MKSPRLFLPVLLLAPVLLCNDCGYGNTDLPECLQKAIGGGSDGSLPTVIISDYIARYTYEGQVVYYTPSQCCDIPSFVYDQECRIVCSPDGGFTGAGDGKCPGFFEKARNKIVVWRRE